MRIAVKHVLAAQHLWIVQCCAVIDHRTYFGQMRQIGRWVGLQIKAKPSDLSTQRVDMLVHANHYGTSNIVRCGGVRADQ